MSEKREKKRRYNLRLEYIKKFSDWLAGEPPIWDNSKEPFGADWWYEPW